MLLVRDPIHKLLFRVTICKDHGQTVLGLNCLSRPFRQTTSVQSLRTFTIVETRSFRLMNYRGRKKQLNVFESIMGKMSGLRGNAEQIFYHTR